MEWSNNQGPQMFANRVGRLGVPNQNQPTAQANPHPMAPRDWRQPQTPPDLGGGNPLPDGLPPADLGGGYPHPTGPDGPRNPNTGVMPPWATQQAQMLQSMNPSQLSNNNQFQNAQQNPIKGNPWDNPGPKDYARMGGPGSVPPSGITENPGAPASDWHQNALPKLPVRPNPFGGPGNMPPPPPRPQVPERDQSYTPFNPAGNVQGGLGGIEGAANRNPLTVKLKDNTPTWNGWFNK